MSTCPSKDIHSIYLDNEMPEKYKAEYEAHINSCPKCKSELEKLKGLQSILRQDSDSLTPDSHYLDESFERLTLKMNYSKNTRKADKRNFGSYKYVLTAAAAAAVFALIIPFRFNTNKNTAPVQAAAVASNYSNIPAVTNVSFGSGKSRVISGNIQESVLPSTAVMNAKHNVNYREHPLIDNVDVFKPSFDGEKTISIKITVPGMNAVPVSTEIELPVNVIAGQY